MSLKQIQKFIASPNIAELLSEERLAYVSSEVISGFEADKASMSDWLNNADEIMRLANLPKEQKHWPWPNASNIKYPLLTMAIIQFGARTLPEFARNGDIVKHRTIGRDLTGLKSRKGRRIAEYLNYKLMDESSIWWNEHDKLLHVVSAIGTAFTKSCYNPLTGQIESKLLNYRDIIVNNSISCLEEAPRISHRVALTENDIVQGIRAGFYTDLDPILLRPSDEFAEIEIELIEQHCWLDLDEDGYKEPYIVLMHIDSNSILRITANFDEADVILNSKDQIVRINKKHYFTDYHFLPNPDGSFYSNGFGTLLLSLNDTANTILNQLVDAGTLANTQGGFIGKGLRIRKEKLNIAPGEWVTAEASGGRKISEEVFPLTYKEPSSVLFQLLGMIINATRELTSTTEVMTGNVETQNTSPNTLAQTIQQGMTVYLAIQRRIFAGLKKELGHIYKLYSKYIDPQEYITVLDLSEQEMMEVFANGYGQIADFDLASADVVPVADQNSSTELQRALKAQGLMNMAVAAAPIFNMQEVVKEVLISQGFTEPERFLAPPQQGPNLEEIKLQSEIADRSAKTQVEERKLQLEAERVKTERLKAEATAIKALADAEAVEVGTQLDQYQLQVDNMFRTIEVGDKSREIDSKVAANAAKSAGTPKS
jgi:chaperonin GroES